MITGLHGAIINKGKSDKQQNICVELIIFHIESSWRLEKPVENQTDTVHKENTMGLSHNPPHTPHHDVKAKDPTEMYFLFTR